MQITGQCHCGQISFQALVDPERVAACHCSDCQTFSGSPFRTSVQVPAAQITFKGTPKHYVKVAASGNRRVQGFCPQCGTQLYACDPEPATQFNIRIGCVNERAQLAPKAQMWTCSAMPWLKHLPEIRAHEMGPNSPVVQKQA
jgi:hypothetical protein